jgi:hypothetical protein
MGGTMIVNGRLRTLQLVSGVTLGFFGIVMAQTGPPSQQKWNNAPPPKSSYSNDKGAPAPRRDLSGIWDGSAEGGTQAKGPKEYPALLPDHPQDEIGGQPDESNILKQLPYTPAGLAALKTHKPGVGVRAVGPGLVNDPVDFCNPVGYPRMQFFEFRVIEIAQMSNRMLYLNQFHNAWRVIWTDGRALPHLEDVSPRWNGYSVGKWTDDYTFEAETVGMNESTWLDNPGRPHSDALRVKEIFHRVSRDRMELTVTVTDSKMYTRPWNALDKFVLHRLPDDYDVEEFICAPAEVTDYNNSLATPVSGPTR